MNGPPTTPATAPGPPPLTLTRFGLAAPDEAVLDALRARFDASHVVRLPGFLDPALLALIRAHLADAPFVPRRHGAIGVEECLAPGTASALLEWLGNDPALLAAVERITGCGRLGCFDGRVYRLVPGAGHHDSWHGDVGETRRVALSVNLGARPHAGGILEIARTDADALLARVVNTGAGDAVIFRIAPWLRHRVTAPEGAVARTAWAGWFRAAPEYAALAAARRRDGERAPPRGVPSAGSGPL